MSEKQEMETDGLVSVIQVIQLGRKTGVLIARRGEGINIEKGVITFVNGKATEMQVGRHKGPEAFNLLCLWGRCLFTFSSANPLDKLVFPASPQPSPSINSVPHMGSAADGKTPEPFTAVSPLRARVTPPPQPVEPPKMPPPVTPPAIVIPSRSRQLGSALQVIEKLKLSRVHRQVLLLIDGQRSNTELERLTGRSHEEIHKILRDLEHAAIIQIQR